MAASPRIDNPYPRSPENGHLSRKRSLSASPTKRKASNGSEFASSRIFVVGAGGIGCELLKNLALMGVGHITVVDLDTIDVSNLNRQFLFRRRHVDRSKAEVAAEAAKRMNPDLEIVPLLGNIKSAQFSPSFVGSFDAVLSALDNVEARKHLNRICLAADVPLIEAGSAGYVGQSSVIQKGISECYECQRKEAPKTFPVCTIRSTPSTPVHCVHWARLLYDALFGPEDPGSVMGDLRKELMGVQSEPPAPSEEGAMTASTPVSVEGLPSSLFFYDFLFCSEISKQAALEELWRDGRCPPRPLPLSVPLPDAPTNSQEISSIPSLQAAFLHATDRLFSERANLIGTLGFSKDDSLAVDFVSAAANLRMSNYGIERVSKFQVESIAGAIVPAIATTNAIVAGLQCLNLRKLLRGKTNLKDVWVHYPSVSGGGWILQPTVPAPPRQDCFACSSQFIFVRVKDITKLGIKHLVKSAIIQDLHINEPSVFIKRANGTSVMCYDPFEDEEDAHDTILTEWDIADGSILQVEAETGSCQIAIIADENLQEEIAVMKPVSRSASPSSKKRKP